MKFNTDYFNILRKIQNNPNLTQRDLAKDLGISLGKFNYCLKALKLKGLVKINNFKKSDKKIRYLYMLTPEGISLKTKLTVNFMKIKMIEYEELKKEIND
jgi:EPS-associated MarR family transcriptional regulator